jgi:hypothetical protein
MLKDIILLLCGGLIASTFIIISAFIDLHITQYTIIQYSEKNKFKFYFLVCSWEMIFFIAGIYIGLVI